MMSARHRRQSADAFTLIEVMLASVMAALILVAVYTVFSQSIKLRDSATRRARALQVRERASRIIRGDLRNIWVSGGTLAGVLDSNANSSDNLDNAMPGYFKFTTTTGKDTADDLFGDVQQVEYYISKDEAGGAPGAVPGGHLMRALTRDLLETTPPLDDEQSLLEGVTSFSVAYYDGANWQDTWQLNNTPNSGDNSTTTTSAAASAGTTGPNLPQAIRFEIDLAAPSPKDNVPPPLIILMPWTAQAFSTKS